MIPRRPQPMPDEICLCDDIGPEIFDTTRFIATKDLAAHEHAVAKRAVEALREIQRRGHGTEPGHGYTFATVAKEVLTEISASGWTP